MNKRISMRLAPLALSLLALAGCSVQIISGGGSGDGPSNAIQPPDGETTGGTGGTAGGTGTGGAATGGTGGTGGVGGMPTEVSGVCIIRSGDLSSFWVPDVAWGYARKVMPGLNDITLLQAACTDAIFADLLALYCAANVGNTADTQMEVVTYQPNGEWATISCAAQGCDPVYCP